MKSKKYLQNFALVIFSLAFTIFALEIVIGVFARITHNDRSMINNSVLGWKMVPHSIKAYDQEEEPYVININSQGFRDKEYSYQKPSSTFRIVVIGNSFVFGSGGGIRGRSIH